MSFPQPPAGSVFEPRIGAEEGLGTEEGLPLAPVPTPEHAVGVVDEVPETPVTRDGRPSQMSVHEHETVQAMNDEEALTVGALLQSQSIMEAIRGLRPQQLRFLKMRMLSTTDVEARHKAGKPRWKSDRQCGCTFSQKGWSDLHEGTLLRWKKDPLFIYAYDMMRTKPLIFAATRLEHLTPAAVEALADILDPAHVGKDSDKIRAAEKVLQAGGLMRGEGQQQAQSALHNSIQFQTARERMRRGLQITEFERRLLLEGGVNPEEARPVVRTLDGEDMPTEYVEAQLA